MAVIVMVVLICGCHLQRGPQDRTTRPLKNNMKGTEALLLEVMGLSPQTQTLASAMTRVGSTGHRLHSYHACLHFPPNLFSTLPPSLPFPLRTHPCGVLTDLLQLLLIRRSSSSSSSSSSSGGRPGRACGNVCME
ncbi:hypothetical protein VYU27_003108 [Nannochloropsis oceanica]